MIKEFQLQPTDFNFKKTPYEKSKRLLKSERNRVAYEEAKEDLFNLIKPVVGWNVFQIDCFKNEKVKLIDGTEIGGGPVVQVIKGAVEIILAICSIGPAVEERTREYMKSKKMFKGVILDSLASWAVDKTRKKFCNWITKEIHMNEGYRTSIMLSPGDSEWLITEQSTIFKLLKQEAEEIDVRLTESMLMIPLKSLSLLIGAGPNHLGKEDGTSCEFCSQRDRCRYSKMRD